MANVISSGTAAISSGPSPSQPAGADSSNSLQPIELPSARRRAIQFIRRGVRCLALVLAFYGAACLIGLSPVNTHFKNAAGGVEVFVYTDPLQSKILVPARSTSSNWEVFFPREEFPGAESGQTYLAFSWEDRQFALNTPTWRDANYVTALRAGLLPTESVMRVEYCERPQEQSGCRRMVLDAQQYSVLSQQILASLEHRADHKLQRVQGAADGSRGGFYEAHGLFYFLSTGNTWTGACLKRAGVRTGMWTPFSVGVAQVTE